MRSGTYFSWTLWLPVVLPLVLSALFAPTNLTALLTMSLVGGGVPYIVLALILWQFWSRGPRALPILVRVWLGPLLAFPVLFVIFMALNLFVWQDDPQTGAISSVLASTLAFGKLFLLFGYPYVLLATIGYALLKWRGYITEE